MNQLQLIPSLSENGILTTNAHDLAQAVRAELQKYNYIVTEETYRTAKNDRASLNNLATQLATSRKHLEDQVFGRWKNDKAEIMQIERDIKDTSSLLGDGIKAIDDEARQARAEKLNALWNALGGNLYDFNAILKKHKGWTNKTAKEDDIHKEMAGEIFVLKNGENTVLTASNGLPAGEKQYVIDAWFATTDLQYVMGLIDSMKASLQKETAPNLEEVQPEPIQSAPEQAEPEIVTAEPAKLYTRTFTVEGTREQIQALVQCMKDIDIRITYIKKGKD